MASFLLLGPLEVRVDGEPVPVNGSRQQIVLSMLLLHAGRVISRERLVTAVWDEDEPPTSRAQINISISKLRAFLVGIGLPDAIVTREPGYLMRVPPEDIDAVTFAQLAAAGRDAARRGEPENAAAQLRKALGCWRGDAFAGTRSRLVQAAAIRLDEERLAVTEECIELDLSLGRHRDVIGELRDLVEDHPLREKFYGQFMQALYRDGRQAEALEAYRQARQVLVEEHGLDPSESLQALERAILTSDPAAAAPVAPRSVAPERTVPRQLPVRARGFVGRTETLQPLRRMLTDLDPGGAVVVVTGPPGVGKTTLAVETAYDVAQRFPDGQLFARLRGGDSRPVAPEQILDYFLRALGVPPASLPSDRHELAGLYRSRTAGLALLVVLDDADNARQVEPLLPASVSVATIVTSRGALTGLPNATRFDLEAFSPAVSRALLVQVIGAARVDAESDAAEAIAAACGHLPLALQIAAAKLAARAHWRIARMASRLDGENGRLDELSLDGAGVRASIAISFEALSALAQRLLVLLGSLGVTDFTSWVTSPLLAVDAYHGADVLDELVDARLVEVQVGDGANARYRLHDLVGVFARELLAASTSSAERGAALHRLLRCWCYLASQAHRREYGGDFTLPRLVTQPWILPDDLVDDLLGDPIGWFESEQINLVAAVRLAADLNYDDLCCDLSVTSVTFFEARARREDWQETHAVAFEAAVRNHNERAEAIMRYSRAGLALVEQRFVDASADLQTALAWFEQAGDRQGCGLALRGLGSIDRLQGRADQAQTRYRRALVDLRASGDRVAEAHVLINLAETGHEGGQSAQAEALLRQALEICAEFDVRRVAAQARYRLGRLYLDQGVIDRAQVEFEAVLGMVTTAADPVGKAYALVGIGTVQLKRGDRGGAEATLSSALAMMRREGSRVGEGQALLLLAELNLPHRPVEAAGHLDAAAGAFETIGAARWLDRVAQLRAQLCDDAGDLPV